MIRKILIALGSTVLAAGLAVLLIYILNVCINASLVIPSDFLNNLTIVVGVFYFGVQAKIFYDLFTKD